MQPPARRRTTPNPLAALAALLVAAGCITADGTIKQDGSASLTLNFPTPATATDDKAARALVSAPDVTIESLAITDAAPGERGPRRATAKLTTKSVAAFGDLPLLRVVGMAIDHQPKAGGGGTLRLELKNATPKKKDDPDVAAMMKHQALVRLHTPGPVVETSGTRKDGAVEWSFPAGDWTAGKQLVLTVSYGAAAGAGSESPAGTENAPES